MKNIRPGMPLFLFNYSDRKLYGIFEAISAGQMNIDPYAWTADGAVHTPYPAQVGRFDHYFVCAAAFGISFMTSIDLFISVFNSRLVSEFRRSAKP